ncbi:MAG: hypothetical protein ACI3W8_05760 [Oscillospiraceae bacterium]
MTDAIWMLAASLCHPAAEQEELLRLLCAAAESELTAKLKEGCTAEDCGEAFTCAAALLAAADFRAGLTAGGEPVSFTAGSVSVSTGGAESAAMLRRQARRLLSGRIEDDGFAFQGVRG